MEVPYLLLAHQQLMHRPPPQSQLVIELRWHMLVAQVHAHGMLLCVCWWYENMSKLFQCSRPTRPQEHSVHAGS